MTPNTRTAALIRAVRKNLARPENQPKAGPSKPQRAAEAPTTPRALAQHLIDAVAAIDDRPATDHPQTGKIAALLKAFTAYIAKYRKQYDANDELQNAYLQLLTLKEDSEEPPDE